MNGPSSAMTRYKWRASRDSPPNTRRAVPRKADGVRSCIILGSGRSGTSMVAGTLRQCGYYMGPDLLNPGLSNPKGFFESREINELNEDILRPFLPRKHEGPLKWMNRRRPQPHQLWLAYVGLRVAITAT